MPREKYKCVYDIEIFVNLATFTFKDYETGTKYKFVIFADQYSPRNNINQVNDLLDFIEKRLSWAIGYNSIGFDDILLKSLYLESKRVRASDPRKITKELKELADEIISFQKQKKTSPRAYAFEKYKSTFRSLDLMLIFNPIDRVSLKQLGINMKWPKVMENPLPIDKPVAASDIDKVLEYNDNDVDITEQLLFNLSEEINNRIAYTIKFGTDVINSPNSTIGRQIILDYYAKATGIPAKQLLKMRSNYDTLRLGDCVSNKISFKTKEYRRILDKVVQTEIDPNKEEDTTGYTVEELEEMAREGTLRKEHLKKKKSKPEFELLLRSKYLSHAMKLGGLHSENQPEIIEESDHFLYIDIDVRGYYPRIIINERYFPAHLAPVFVDIFKEKIVDERDRIVKEDPILAYMLKIAANATFGLTDAESWLKDPKMAKSITINGQLYLFMLMEWLEHYSKCVIVYSNTDGLTVRVPRSEQSRFYFIVKRWEAYTGFQLEYNYYRKMIIRDVNNYLMFTHSTDPKKRIKAKGAYVVWRPIHKGYNYPIVAQAVQNHYDIGQPIEKTIMECNDIYYFMKAERTSMEKFDVVLFSNQGNTELQKNNRWIVTHNNPDEGRLYKISKTTNERTEMQSGYRVTPIPNVDSQLSIQDYRLNYDFYIEQAKNLIDLTKPVDEFTGGERIYQGVLEFT